MPKKILLIEDEEILGNMYKHKFERKGFKVVLVLTSSQADEALKKEKPDLILLDILLSDESGLDWLAKIKKNVDTLKTPVVALSNYGDPQTIKQARKLGVKDYLLKSDFTPAKLAEKVKEYL